MGTKTNKLKTKKILQPKTKLKSFRSTPNHIIAIANETTDIIKISYKTLLYELKMLIIFNSSKILRMYNVAAIYTYNIAGMLVRYNLQVKVNIKNNAIYLRCLTPSVINGNLPILKKVM